MAIVIPVTILIVCVTVIVVIVLRRKQTETAIVPNQEVDKSDRRNYDYSIAYYATSPDAIYEEVSDPIYEQI